MTLLPPLMLTDGKYPAHRHNLRFCKTALQSILSEKNDLQNRFTENSESADFIGKNDLQNRFTENSESADYDDGKNVRL